ncbi:fumarylacetoacetate hydrolase family protein [Streptomyces mirabilis]|uniref:fumarylacetoacetate hydrolase family protein n=1 Tax=Streptomyces mirabilis TaxID=68239 RepID=UPI0033E9E8C3
MRWLTYESPTNGDDRVGLLVDGVVHGLQAPARMADLLTSGPDGLHHAAEQARQRPAEVLAAPSVRFRAPVPVPPSVRDFMSFEEHVVTSAQALGGKISPSWYDTPAFYFSNPAAVLGPTEPVEISPGSTQFDYELEIAAIIGTPGSDISPADAEAHIAGYTILADWSARDLQRNEMRSQLGPAKGKDSATSIGPTLVTPDELRDHRTGNGYALGMRASVNGNLYSEGSWSTIYWSFEQMIAYASRGTRLVPGDVIGSGTVGSGCILELSLVHGSDRFPFLEPGDTVELEVEQLGTISSVIQPAKPVIPLTAGAQNR